MTETVSASDENLILLEGVEAFQKHACQLVEQAGRNIDLLSHQLDFTLYHDTDFTHYISQLARRDRRSRVRILVKDIQPLIDRNHALLRLARRLTSKISIHKLTLEPQDNRRAYLIGDRRIVLYQHDDDSYAGFVNYEGGPEAKNLLEEFNYLWEHHSVEDPNLRRFVI